MARKDDILKSFLTHAILENKYELKQGEMPKTIREALDSDIAIVKAIALVVDALDGTSTVTDSVLRNQVTQFLNEAL